MYIISTRFQNTVVSNTNNKNSGYTGIASLESMLALKFLI